jgi:AcrR family transcriptional regulator
MPKEPLDARRRILDASIALVAEQGVRAVSFREVARRAGVSHQTPYHHFGDHVGILREVAREGFVSLADAMQSAADRAGDDPYKALHEAGVAYVKFARTNVGHFRVMFQGPLIVSEEQPPLEEGERTFETLVRLVTAAHKAGAGRGLSVEAISRLAWSTVHGLSLLLIEQCFRMKDIKVDDAAITRQVVGALSHLFDDRARR